MAAYGILEKYLLLMLFISCATLTCCVCEQSGSGSCFLATCQGLIESRPQVQQLKLRNYQNVMKY